MKHVKRVSIVLLVAVCAFLLGQKVVVPVVMAQQAKMMLVEKVDSDKLKAEYGEYLKAYEKWEKAKKDVAKGYVNYGGKPLKGWEEVSFSVDFRILVPAERYGYGTVMIGSQGPTGPTGPVGSMSVSMNDAEK